ncbi:MAG: hypothetical protein RL685_5076 [Pseudomonadota bacterium]
MPTIAFARALLSRRTRRGLRFDLMRLRARLRHRRLGLVPEQPLLHLGCGKRRIPGFLNVDVAGSEYDVDLGFGKLPWADGSFDAVVAQQVIEHLDLEVELPALLSEVRRVLRPGGQIWLSCPDMERVCRSYLEDRGASLVSDRVKRWPDFSLGSLPPQHMVNVVFHQAGEHLNLFDYPLLAHVLQQQGFVSPVRVAESDLRQRFPEFPLRDDDDISLYVTAQR